MRTLSTRYFIRTLQTAVQQGRLAAQIAIPPNKQKGAGCVYEGVVEGKVAHCAIGWFLSPDVKANNGHVVHDLLKDHTIDFEHRGIAAVVQKAHDKWACGNSTYTEQFFEHLLELIADTTLPDSPQAGNITD